MLQQSLLGEYVGFGMKALDEMAPGPEYADGLLAASVMEAGA